MDWEAQVSATSLARHVVWAFHCSQPLRQSCFVSVGHKQASTVWKDPEVACDIETRGMLYGIPKSIGDHHRPRRLEGCYTKLLGPIKASHAAGV